MVSFKLGCMLLWGIAPPDLAETPLVNCGKSYDTVEACLKDQAEIEKFNKSGLGDNAFVISSCGKVE